MPKVQYIKHDVLQIYIFKSYVWFQIKEIAKRWLCYDGPDFPEFAPEGAGERISQSGRSHYLQQAHMSWVILKAGQLTAGL